MNEATPPPNLLFPKINEQLIKIRYWLDAIIEFMNYNEL
jgi:hypothetical protein